MTQRKAFEQLAEDYSLISEPLTVKSRHEDCLAAWRASRELTVKEYEASARAITDYNEITRLQSIIKGQSERLEQCEKLAHSVMLDIGGKECN